MFFILMWAGKFFRGKNYSCDQISSLYSNSRIWSNRQEDFNREVIQVVLGFVYAKKANNQVFFNPIRTTEAAPSLQQSCTNAAPTLHRRCTNAVPMLHQSCTNAVPTLHQRCTNAAPTLHQRCTNAAPTLQQGRTNAAPMLHQSWTNAAPMLQGY